MILKPGSTLTSTCLLDFANNNLFVGGALVQIVVDVFDQLPDGVGYRYNISQIEPVSPHTARVRSARLPGESGVLGRRGEPDRQAAPIGQPVRAASAQAPESRSVRLG